MVTPRDRRTIMQEYDGRPIFDHVDDAVPDAGTPDSQSLLVYVMGPYTPFDLGYVDEEAANVLERPYVDGDLFDPARHEDMEQTLRDLCDALRRRNGVRAFVATDVDVPTPTRAEESGLDEPGLSVLDQSVEFAAVSDAVVFVLDSAGLNAGVGAEVGSVLGEFDLRNRNPDPASKPRERFRIYHDRDFSSASIDETPYGYGVGTYEYRGWDDLVTNCGQFLVEVERKATQSDLPLYEGP